MGFKYKISKKVIYLTKEHRQRRIETIKQWFLQNQKWSQTVFSDEKRFCLDSPDNWGTYCMAGEDNKRVTRPCEGGGVLVWLMVLPNGLVSHKIIRGKFKAVNYIDLLKQQAIPIMKLNFHDEFVFQEDNSMVHKAHIVKKFFERSGIEVLNWPAKSPDINIAEDIWRMISNIVYRGPQYTNKKSLESSINTAIFELNSTKRDDIIKLYSSIVPRLLMILCKNGCLYNK